MLTLIALSICSATFNYAIVVVLLAVIVIMLVIKEYYIADRITGHGFGYLFISAKPDELSEDLIKSTLSNFVRNTKILSINSDDEFVHYQYSFKDAGALQRDQLLSSLKSIPGIESINISFGQRPI